MANYPRGINSTELHFNRAEPDKQEAHIEYWNGRNEKLIPNKWDGVMANSASSEQGSSCSWLSESWSSTLDQATNHVPDLLGSTITAQINNIHIFEIATFVYTGIVV